MFSYFNSIVTSDGFYCSVAVEPDVVALGYTGLKLYTYSFATNIYFQSNIEYSVDPALLLLEQYIPAKTGIPTAAFYTAANASGMNFLHEVKLEYNFEEKLAKLE